MKTTKSLVVVCIFVSYLGNISANNGSPLASVSLSPHLPSSLHVEVSNTSLNRDNLKEGSSQAALEGNQSKNYTNEHGIIGTTTVCTQKDSAALNKCLQQVLKDLKPRLAQGIPEINLPPMEPLKFDNIKFQQGSGAVRILSEFTNVRVSGLTNFSQSDFWVDVPKRTLDFDLIFPQLSLAGVYELSGNLFFVPIGGNGTFHLSLGGARTKGVSKLGIIKNNTVAHVAIKKTEVNLDISTIKVHLTNLFNGDPLLGTFVNNFLNENSQEVFEEVKPQIKAQVGEMLSLMANRALSALSTQQFEDVPFDTSVTD